jgi:ssDNA-binding Zn-finger/Zn-ribbon topoisomerase 1
MKERDGKYGPFFGCTGYPKCKSTRSMKDVETEFDPSNEDLDEYRWDRND